MLFLVFTSLHLFCNFRAVSAVVMETVNSTRMHLLVDHFINHGIVLSPQEISAIEPILTSMSGIKHQSFKITIANLKLILFSSHNFRMPQLSCC